MKRPDDLAAVIDHAARGWHNRQQARRRDAGRLRPDGQPWAFDDLNPHDQHTARVLVTPFVLDVIDALPELDGDR